ncbi:C4-dicarboxylate ABC transporter [Peteryoungia desertarenae]|uniref:C4-dicarboxylate ABC transporter n=1 Tax=Peteryoungia desertarenae TaxID=1813451 RepID=A0ABX6QQU0_9HYPH|nr:SLAC1 anion channel family protein [Peteryoungia desertarenae]QLF70969.1 C4-dicarboxylate ABC transporter [Peteryoungia desertarenae]
MTVIDPTRSEAAAQDDAGLHHLPLPLFAVPMGVGGLGMAWREAAVVLGAPALVGEVLMALAAVFWLLITAAHLWRLFRHPDAFAGDLSHPIRGAFAGAISIGLMIVAGGLVPYSVEMASTIWLLAVLLHLAIGVFIVRSLLLSPREAATLTPPLLIPLVGNILAPVVGAKLGFMTLSWMLFGLGGLLWILVQPLILYRIATGPMLPQRMWPTLVILLAPPAVGSLALSLLTEGFGPGPLAIYGFAVLMAAVLLSLIPQFRSVPFAMSWWGYTFPAAAFTAVTLKFAHAYPFAGEGLLLWALLIGVTGVILMVLVATLKALFAGHLFRPE